MWVNISKVGNFNTLPLKYNISTSSYELDTNELYKYKGNIFTIPQFNYIEFNKNILSYGFEEQLDKNYYRCKLYQEYIEYKIEYRGSYYTYFYDKIKDRLIEGSAFLLLHKLNSPNIKCKEIILKTSYATSNGKITIAFNDEFIYEHTVSNKDTTIVLKNLNYNKSIDYCIMSNVKDTNNSYEPEVSLVFEDGTIENLSIYSVISIVNNKFYALWNNRINNVCLFRREYHIMGAPTLTNFGCDMCLLDLDKDYTCMYIEGESPKCLNKMEDEVFKLYGHVDHSIYVGVPFENKPIFKKDVLNTLINVYNNKYFDNKFLMVLIDNKQYIKQYNKKYVIMHTGSIYKLLSFNGRYNYETHEQEDLSISFGFSFTKNKEYIEKANMSVNILEVI